MFLMSFLGSLIENAIMTFFVRHFCGPSKLNRQQDYLLSGGVITLLMLMSFTMDTANSPLLLILPLLLLFLYAMVFLTPQSRISAIFYPVFIFMLLLMIDVSVITLTKFLLSFDPNSLLVERYNGFIIFFSKIIFAIIYIYVVLIKKLNIIITKTMWRYFGFTSILMLLMSFIVCVIYMEKEHVDTLLLMLSILIISLYLTILGFMILMTTLNSTALINRREIELLSLNKNQNQVIKLLEKNNSVLHDINKHLLVLHGLASKRGANEIVFYLDNVLGEIKSSTIITNSNPILEAIINYYAAQMQEANISFRHQVSDDLLFINDVDVTVILGNLLENAIEAQTDIVSPMIDLKIINNHEITYLKITNTYQHTIQKKSNALVSTKQGGRHGYGIKNIEQIAKQYQADVDIHYEDMFTIMLTFYHHNRSHT